MPRTKEKRVRVEFDNTLTKVTGLERKDEVALWQKLSYRIETFGVKEVRYRHLFNRVTKLTYTGLLPYVVNYLKTEGIDYVTVDRRPKLGPEHQANFSLVDCLDGDPAKPLELRPYQRQIVDGLGSRAVVQCATGGGKAMPLDTPVLTPEGFKPLGDVHVGDVVYDERGEKTTVVGEYPQGVKQEYRVTFKDGTSVKCCEDHLWKYTLNTAIKGGVRRWQVRSLKDVLARYRTRNSNGWTMGVPVCKAIQFDPKDLPVEPYRLGVVVGRGVVSTNGKSVVLARHALNPDVAERAGVTTESLEVTLEGLVKDDERRVPVAYLTSAVADRLELLKGWVDSAGYLDTKGRVRFLTTSEGLMTDFKFLVRSLGYRVIVRESSLASGRVNYTAEVSTDQELFSCERHLAKFRRAMASRRRRYYYDALKVVSVERLDTASEMKCIAVDSPEHTFVCGDFIVTHNTVVMAAAIAKFNVKPVAVFATTNALCEQLQRELSRFLGVPVGLVGNGRNRVEDVTVYSVQSVTEDMLRQTALILFDECQHVPCETCHAIAKLAVNAVYRVGVSATPWRDSGDDLLIEAALAPRNPKTAVSASDLIKMGYLIKPKIYFVPVRDSFPGNNYARLYAAAITQNTHRNLQIRRIVKELYERGRHVLVLVKIIEHGERLLELIKAAIPDADEKKATVVVDQNTGGESMVRVGRVEFIQGEDGSTRRTAVLNAVKEGTCRVLIATTIADEGLDLPILDTLVLAGGGKSSTKAYQRIGRVLRLYEGKTNAFVFDFMEKTPLLRRHSQTRKRLYDAEPEWEVDEFVVNP